MKINTREQFEQLPIRDKAFVKFVQDDDNKWYIRTIGIFGKTNSERVWTHSFGVNSRQVCEEWSSLTFEDFGECDILLDIDKKYFEEVEAIYKETKKQILAFVSDAERFLPIRKPIVEDVYDETLFSEGIIVSRIDKVKENDDDSITIYKTSVGASGDAVGIYNSLPGEEHSDIFARISPDIFPKLENLVKDMKNKIFSIMRNIPDVCKYAETKRSCQVQYFPLDYEDDIESI